MEVILCSDLTAHNMPGRLIWQTLCLVLNHQNSFSLCNFNWTDCSQDSCRRNTMISIMALSVWALPTWRSPAIFLSILCFPFCVRVFCWPRCHAHLEAASAQTLFYRWLQRCSEKQRAPWSERSLPYWIFNVSPVSWGQGSAGHSPGQTHAHCESPRDRCSRPGFQNLLTTQHFYMKHRKEQQFCRKPCKEFLRQCSHE